MKEAAGMVPAALCVLPGWSEQLHLAGPLIKESRHDS